ncbi:MULTISPECIES: RNA methyltransferase [Actinomycetes]|uniref:TrmH family RNA methyltransferase n=1 Tax=Actinomycetes TaxID=1760 RepID=UPI000CFD878F|nr:MULTISPECIES: RNA methyltransferase [unclassified Arthrobacter]PQZ87141.1 rRNA methyltransferase [Arthrobacter sp. MYb222]TDU29544.1 tRNA G18 (ribose-2'-O)-methylase SpoU [Arthrobacter sp. JUb115]
MAEILNPERILPVADLADSRLDEYLRLSEANLRMRTDVENGLYIAESTKVVQRAINAGHVPRSFLLAEKHLDQLTEEFNRFPDAPIFIGDDRQLQDLVGFHLHRGAMAAMNRPEPLDLDEVLEASSRVAILEDIADHTNLGAIIRSASGLGVDAVLLTPKCVDPWYRRSARVSMGTVFDLPWVRMLSWPEDIQTLKRHGYEMLAMELTEDAIPLNEVEIKSGQKVAMILGNEGRGVTDEALAAVDRTVIIPMYREVDSLNVGAASAIAFWHLCSAPR